MFIIFNKTAVSGEDVNSPSDYSTDGESEIHRAGNRGYPCNPGWCSQNKIACSATSCIP